MSSAILLISCPDRLGIVAEITQFLADHRGNIEHADQHIDEQTGTFFMRVTWNMEGFDIPRSELRTKFTPLAEEFHMHWELYFSDDIPKSAIFVSKETHCLFDLLVKHREGHFPTEIKAIISNHTAAAPIADYFEIPFFHVPKNPRNREEAERQEQELLRHNQVEVLVLARYHRILTREFIKPYQNRIINIHHSFLPAFVGKNPYAQAYRKGVKIIGATSHYVTAELDAGPIIEQGTERISHRDSVEDLRRKGKDLEKIVLSRAVQWHFERKILVYHNKTVVFD
ncbi:MAG: formyltetrahydrofolate deformylase [Candidatus Omnitrophica bacterium]|nr:formyltetrahydrofolate deformylase [Candidatus Omnitrophota bacterium]